MAGPIETTPGAPILHDGCVSKRTLPRNFRPADAALFGHELEKTIAPMRLIELTNVTANAEGLLFKAGRVLPASFAVLENFEHFRRRTRSQLSFLVRNYLLRRRRRLAGRFLWITDNWSGGYFHWLADTLPRLFVVKDLATTVVLLIPSQYHDLEFVRASLRLFDIAGIDYVQPHEVCISEQIVLPAHAAPSGDFNDALMQELREFILDSYGIDRRSEAHRRIYISRSGAAKRRIANEEEVIGILRDNDFEVVRFEDHPFEQQVRIAAATKYLVSNHGAGLTNMLFMPEGGRVLELRRDGEQERNCFFSLATTARLGYYYQCCPQEHPEDRVHIANVIVDPKVFRENLRLMLKDE